MWCLILFSSIIIALFLYLERQYRKPYISGFKSKSVFITGTDSGFGWTLALNLDKKGLKVYAGCYTKEGAEKLREAASEKLKVIPIDITKIDSVIRAKELIEEDLGPDGELWGLVNNAGVLEGYAFCVSSREDYRNIMETNFFGTINVTDTFLPLIKKSAGRVATIISIAGRASGVLEPYTCSKHALEPYCDGLRRWMKRYGVHAAILEPGSFTFTNLFNNTKLEDNMDKAIAKLPQQLRDEYGEALLNEVKQNLISMFKNPVLSNFNHPSMVTNAINHALFAVHPKDRYTCGIDCKYCLRFTTLLPDYITDMILYWWFSYFRIPNAIASKKKYPA